MTREDAVAKPWREALDLGFDTLGHIDCRSVGHVTVSPGNVFSFRRARLVKERWLGEQNERALGMLSVGDDAFGSCNLFKRAAEMDSPGAQAIAGFPWNRLGERVVDFEGSRTGFKPSQGLPKIQFQPVTGDGEQLARAYVAKEERVARETIKGSDR